ncbi:MAG: BPL-N domain-containing protein [Parachlamydiaceae bacterium]
MRKILIYSGPGALKAGIQHLMTTLNKVLRDSIEIETIGYKGLVENNWEKQTSLFILPGGADVPYVKYLTGIGNAKIRAFIEKGGAFLGICAGSYYASSFVEFALDSPLEVRGKRELSFFQGAVKGPILKPYSYSSHEGSLASPIIWSFPERFNQNQQFVLFYSGGGYFDLAENTPSTNILATYALQGFYPAIIECKVGKGTALLSGVHFEYDASLLNPQDPFLCDIIPTLSAHESERLQLTAYLLERLGIE